MWTQTWFVRFENSAERAGKRKGNSVSGPSVNNFEDVKQLRENLIIMASRAAHIPKQCRTNKQSNIRSTDKKMLENRELR